MTLSLATTLHVPAIQGRINAWAFAAGLQGRWNPSLLAGLIGLNVGLYLDLLANFVSVLGSPKLFPSVSILLEVVTVLAIPLVVGVGIVGRIPSHHPRSLKVPLIATLARLASFSGPIPVAGWECNVHPEGDKYFRHVRLRTVTRVSPQNLAAGRILEQAATALSEAVGPALADVTVEIYLNIPEDGKNTVQYYYVDHRNRQVFWAHATSTVELGLEPFDSDGFLKSALTGEYWNHVENFPCHQVFWSEAEDELKGILAYGAIDDLTSSGSTCPWSGQECVENKIIIGGPKACDLNEHIPYRVVSIGATLGDDRIDAGLLATGHQAPTVMASASLSGASLPISLILHQAHSRDHLATTPDISAYIMQFENYYHELQSALTGEYWNHVENFHCHQFLWSEADDELRVFLLTARLDLTSPGQLAHTAQKNAPNIVSSKD
ncbi:hypothetical protein FRB90_012279 [Tulasnella sp. 427]|nr:hypothetical protein FRB90_012279 [Tulasnella sp. 427]